MAWGVLLQPLDPGQPGQGSLTRLWPRGRHRDAGGGARPGKGSQAGCIPSPAAIWARRVRAPSQHGRDSLAFIKPSLSVPRGGNRGFRPEDTRFLARVPQQNRDTSKSTSCQSPIPSPAAGGQCPPLPHPGLPRRRRCSASYCTPEPAESLPELHGARSRARRAAARNARPGARGQAERHSTAGRRGAWPGLGAARRGREAGESRLRSPLTQCRPALEGRPAGRGCPSLSPWRLWESARAVPSAHPATPATLPPSQESGFLQTPLGSKDSRVGGWESARYCALTPPWARAPSDALLPRASLGAQPGHGQLPWNDPEGPRERGVGN